MVPILMLSWLARLKFGSQDDRVDAIWRAKRHQVRAQRRSWGPQVGAKGAQKGHGHHWPFVNWGNVGAPGPAKRYLSKLRYRYYRTERTGGLLNQGSVTPVSRWLGELVLLSYYHSYYLLLSIQPERLILLQPYGGRFRLSFMEGILERLS